jgi:hypothetical protein
MQQRTLLPLAAVTAAVVALAGWYVARQDPPATNLTNAGPLYPGLAGAIDTVARIEFQEGGKTAVIVRKDDVWGVEDRHGYPANLDLVKSTVVGLAQAKIVEPRTSQPDLYPRIGVEDPGAPGATSKRLTLKDADGKALADLIVGKENFQTAMSRGQSNYVRRAGEAQSWLITAPMERLAGDSIRWIDRTLPKLERERLASIIVRQADGAAVSMTKTQPADASFAVTGLPAGTKVKTAAVDEMAGAVNLFAIDDVEPFAAKRFEGGTAAVYTTFDGVVLTIRQAKDGDSRWLHFEAAYNAEAAKPFADSKAPGLLPTADAEAKAKEWQTRFAAWSYKVSDAMGDSFARKADDFVEKADAQPAPAPAP